MSWRSFKGEITVLLLCAATVAVFKAFGINCLVRRITGLPCPACGMTRAVFALLRGDFLGYAASNAMALPVAAAFCGELFIKAFGKHKKSVHIYTVTVLVLNLIYYVLRLLTQTTPSP